MKPGEQAWQAKHEKDSVQAIGNGMKRNDMDNTRIVFALVFLYSTSFDVHNCT